MPRARWVWWLFTVGCFAESDVPSQSESSTGGEHETSTSASSPSTTTATSGDATGMPTSTTVDPSDTTSDETDTGACGEDQRPAPPVPAEWEGPFMLLPGPDGGDPPACPPELVPAAQDVVTAEPSAECRCTCELTCVVETFASGDCSGPATTAMGVAPRQCVDGAATSVRYTGLSDPKDCNEPTATLGETTWNQVLRVCGSDQQAECVPTPPAAIGPCIRAAGERACPEGLPQRIVSAAEAEHGCAVCPVCVAEADAVCSGLSVALLTNDQCTFATGGLEAGECSDGPVANIALAASLPPVCTPTAGELVALVEPLTFCCAE